MSEIELKPCPFCGAPKWLYVLEDDDGEWYVFCNACKTSVHSEYNETSEYAVKTWNALAIDRDDLLKVADECERADVDGVIDWAERIRKAVGE